MTTAPIPCAYCDGKGFTSLRDCSGDVQREETCSFCEGTGILEKPLPEENQPPRVEKTASIAR